MSRQIKYSTKYLSNISAHQNSQFSLFSKFLKSRWRKSDRISQCVRAAHFSTRYDREETQRQENRCQTLWTIFLWTEKLTFSGHEKRSKIAVHFCIRLWKFLLSKQVGQKISKSRICECGCNRKSTSPSSLTSIFVPVCFSTIDKNLNFRAEKHLSLLLFCQQKILHIAWQIARQIAQYTAQ